MYVLVSVEPEGFVAIPNVPEREFILFNIGSVDFIACYIVVIWMENYTWSLSLIDLGPFHIKSSWELFPLLSSFFPFRICDLHSKACCQTLRPAFLLKFYIRCSLWRTVVGDSIQRLVGSSLGNTLSRFGILHPIFPSTLFAAEEPEPTISWSEFFKIFLVM